MIVALHSCLLMVLALLLVTAIALFESFTGSVSGAILTGAGIAPVWNGIAGFNVPKLVASAVSSDPTSILFKLIAKIFEVVQVLLVSGIAFFAGLLAFRLFELPGNGTGRFAQGTRWLTARFYDHRLWMLSIGWFSFLMTIMLFGQIPAQFQPSIDSENSRVEIETVPGTSLAETRRIVTSVADRLPSGLRLVSASSSPVEIATEMSDEPP